MFSVSVFHNIYAQCARGSEGVTPAIHVRSSTDISIVNANLTFAWKWNDNTYNLF